MAEPPRKARWFRCSDAEVVLGLKKEEPEANTIAKNDIQNSLFGD